jgi:hypothetical protein
VASITKEGINKDMVLNKRPMDYLYTSFLQPFQKMVLQETSRYEIEEIIRLMKTKLACGYDGITTKLIKASAPFISSPFAYLCNKSLSTGIFPSHLKYFEITPIYKKDQHVEL